jgi:hypothetical protein
LSNWVIGQLGNWDWQLGNWDWQLSNWVWQLSNWAIGDRGVGPWAIRQLMFGE